MLRRPWLYAVPLLSLACSTSPTNPSFSLSAADARHALTEMRRTPQPLSRPVLIVGGFVEPGLMPPSVRSTLAPLFTPADKDRFLTASLVTSMTFDDCREKLVYEVDTHFPSNDPTQTTEVDVIAISMGGLAARYAAAPNGGTRQLRIARLFTISSPHRGARLAPLPTLSELQKDMRPGSPFLTALPAPGYPIIPYTRLGDELVGESNAAPDGQTPWWLPNRVFESSHLQAYTDPRILADIARRLRDEPPFTQAPPAPLPE